MDEVSLNGIEDPLANTIIATVMQRPGEPIRVEHNVANENDLIAVLTKAALIVLLDSITSDDLEEEDDEDEEDED